MPSNTVTHIQATVLARCPNRNAWCAMVSVDARSQQQRGVDGGQPERAHGLERLSPCLRARRWHPASRWATPPLKSRPQQGVVQAAQRRHGVRPPPPQGSEESAEEHHFREDEPAHAPAVRQVNLAPSSPRSLSLGGLANPAVAAPPATTTKPNSRAPHAPLVAVDHIPAPSTTKNRPAAAQMGWPDAAGT